ncbi:MAG TPA: hypothetical protein PKX93_04745, partial [bacterium]|nr:hypothetical protein [bacterium]
MNRLFLAFGRKIHWWVLAMLVSYGIIWFSFHCCFLQRHQQKIKLLKEEKEQLDYDYLRLKKSPLFLSKVVQTVEEARAKVRQYTWLSDSPDPNLDFFQYISDILKKNRLVLQELRPAESEKGDTPYFAWTVRVEGNYQDMVRAVAAVEKGGRYLKITQIEITPGEKLTFNLTFL